jgi:hypothetical protein
MMLNWKQFGRKRLWPNFKVLSRHSPGGTEENHENLNQDSRGREPNPGPPDYEVGVLTTRPRRSVALRGVFQYPSRIPELMYYLEIGTYTVPIWP